jgi:hypothetical protein
MKVEDGIGNVGRGRGILIPGWQNVEANGESIGRPLSAHNGSLQNCRRMALRTILTVVNNNSQLA